jgi:hypothetical protein
MRKHKSNKGATAPATPATTPVVAAPAAAAQALLAAGAPAVQVAAAALGVQAPALRLPLPAAKQHNAQHVLLAPNAPVVGAAVAITAKGTNTRKQRVYAYSNAAGGGGVPQQAAVLVVPGFVGVPKGVNAAQWAALQALAGSTVAHCYANGIVSRTVRRAYRAGAIRFGASA